MRMLKLLTAGKSLVDGKAESNRYEVTRKRLLPEFGGKRNPFRATTLPESNSGTPAAGHSAETAQFPGPSHAPDAATGNVPRAEHWRMKLKMTLSRFSRPLLKRLSPPRNPAPKALVQGELSLEKVKVIRNDLTDSDVEVVPAKTNPGKTARPASRKVLIGSRFAQSAWGRVSERVLGSGKS